MYIDKFLSVIALYVRFLHFIVEIVFCIINQFFKNILDTISFGEYLIALLKV
jgi:hypothetical protein